MKRKVAVILAAVILFTSVPWLSKPDRVQAATLIAKITEGSSVSDYYNYQTLAKDVENKYKGKTITIDMMADWNEANDSNVDRRIFISAKTKVTLNMHGLVFNRNNAWKGKDKYNGELILVDKGATLVVNGGTEAERNSHTYEQVAVYTSYDPSGDKASGRGTFKGGLLTGGCSCDGAGGIHARSGTTVILNDVTIAGCGQTRYGKGGGIWMWDDDARLVLNNSCITGCYASSYGGGICVMDDSGITIELNNSSVERNYAGNRGGGIYTDGKKCHIIGRNGARIANNNCQDYGGGLCIWNESASASGLYIHNNYTKYDGGGVYTDDVNISLSNLKVRNNHAERDGGGLYINKNKDSVSSCEFSGNKAGRDGGGVYISKVVTAVDGKTLVRANSAKEQGNDFHLAGNSAGASRVNFKLTKGSEVHVSFSSALSNDVIPVTEGEANDTIKTPNCIQYLYPANPNFHFTYHDAPNMRKIFYVKDGHDSAATGKAYEKPADATNVIAAEVNNASSVWAGSSTQAGIVGTVGPGGYAGSDYNLIRGFSHHQSTAGDMEDIDNVFYYSDAFFEADPKTYNDHLATASLSMAFSGMYLRALEDEDENGNRYYNKHAGIRQFLADIGCPDQNITINESMEKVPGTDTIGVTIASKRLAKSDGTTTGYILIPVVVRGGGYEREWGSNATIGKASTSNRHKEAQGFSEAADQVVMEVEKYITKYQLKDEIEEGKVKFWVTGYSRAGATANITSKRLVETYACDPAAAGKNNHVFCYTCEAPMGGTDEAEELEDKSRYYCIHNLINAVDIVPLVAPELMGFKRYGVDHYIPGKDYSTEVKVTVKNNIKRGGVAGPTKITTYRDNDADYVKNGVGADNTYSAKMLSQLKTIDSSIVFDDYFHPMNMKLVPSVKISEVGDYDNNDVESFVRDFIRYAMEGNKPDQLEHWTQAVKNRDHFADKVQPSLRDTLAVVFSMSDDVSNSFTERAGTLMDKFNTFTGTVALVDIYLEIVGGDEFHYSPNPAYLSGWSNTHPERRKSIIDFFWQKLNETGALDDLDKSDVSALQKAWPNLADFIFTFMESDDKYYPYKTEDGRKWANNSGHYMMLLGTFATYAGYILMNHYPEINLAWARVYDSYYATENTEYRITEVGFHPDAPTAYARDAEGRELVLTKGESTINRLYGDQKIILDLPTIVGEAIYYDLTDDTAGKKLTSNLCYRGGIDLIVDEDAERDYTITCYAISYGIKSEKAVYKLKFDSKHTVEVTGGTDIEQYSYFANQTVTLTPPVPDHAFFKYWDIKLLTKDREELCECAEELLGAEQNMQNASFVMPKVGDTLCSQTVPSGYILQAIWHTEEKIRNIELYQDVEDVPLVPVGGEDLAVMAAKEYTSGEGESARKWSPMMGGSLITWSKEYTEDGEKKTVLVPIERDDEGRLVASKADYDTVYIATVHLAQDPDKNAVFMDNANLTATLRNGAGTYTSISVTRDDADGSVTIVITFKPTGHGPEPVPPEPVTIKANRIDVNTGESVAEQVSYTATPGAKVPLIAPDVENEQFTKWDLKEKIMIDPDSQTSINDRMIVVIIPEDIGDDAEIDILYTPVVSRIDLALKTPVTDETMQMSATDEADHETAKITIGTTYVIHPDFVKIDWSPTPVDGPEGEKIADQITEYTATVSLVTKKDESEKDYFLAKAEGGSEYVKMGGIFTVSPNAEVSMNGEMATLNADARSASYTFPKTARVRYILVSVTTPDNVSGLPHGTSEAEIRDMLPETVKLLVDTGMEIDGDVTWTLTNDATEETRNAVVWTATGDVTLPKDVENPDDVSLHPVFFLEVNEADHASSPLSSLPTGSYLADQITTLETTEEGGTTYYTTDGTDPVESATRKEYNGEEILVCRNDPNLVNETFIGEDGLEHETGRKMFILKAFTVKDGLWDSPVMTFTYVFDNAIPVPAGETFTYNGTDQTLLGSSLYYRVVEDELPEGCHLNEDGEAVAKHAGNYELTLRINDGYQWVVETGEVDEEGNAKKKGTTEDQKVTFTITPASLEEADVRVLTEPVCLDEDTQRAEPEVEVTIPDEEAGLESRLVIDPADYDVVYADNDKPGEGKVWVIGKNNCEGTSSEFTFGIYEDDAYGFSFDPIPDQTYTGKALRPNVQVYYEGTPLTEKKDYTISFKNNTKASDIAEFTVRGRGNYGGSEKGNFTILPKDLADTGVEIAPISSAQYNSRNPKPYKPVPKLTYNRMALKKGRDFNVTYYTDEACMESIDSPQEIGRYYVKLEGIDGSNYTGTAYTEFDIIAPELKPVSKLSVKRIAKQPYTGEYIELKDLGLVVKDGSKELKLDEDYEATCFGLNPGTGWVAITGVEEKGYTGTRIVEFTVTGYPISKVMIEGFEASLPYHAQKIEQENLILSYRRDRNTDPVRLHEDLDYKITYSTDMDEKTNAGKVTMTITGIEDQGYTGSVKKTFRVLPHSLNADNIAISLPSAYPYAKGGAKPEPVVTATFDGPDGPVEEILEPGKDYQLSYTHNKAIHNGTDRDVPTVVIKGKGNYRDTNKSATFAIEEVSMADAGVKVLAKDLEETGKKGKWKSAITVVDQDGNKLSAGKDYVKTNILYSYDEAGNEPVPSDAIVPAGTPIYVRITATGSPYTGDATGHYRILQKGHDISKLSATVVPKDPKLFTNRDVTVDKDDIVWKKGGKPAGISVDDFEIDEDSYRNNRNKGRARVTVYGTGEWGGKKEITYGIGARWFLWWWRL